MKLSDFKHTCSTEHVPLFLEWIKTRGGLAVWRSSWLDAPGESWTAPLNNPDGTPKPKPDNWKIASGPELVVTDAKDVGVANDVEAERIPIKTERGSGFSFNLNSVSSRKVRAAEEKHGAGSWHYFDGDEAVIMKPADGFMPLSEWKPK